MAVSMGICEGLLVLGAQGTLDSEILTYSVSYQSFFNQPLHTNLVSGLQAFLRCLSTKIQNLIIPTQYTFEFQMK